jgi:hypothetical protein
MAGPVQTVRPIAPGYAYSLRVRVTGEDGPVFPAGCALRADLRDSPGAPRAAASLGTADGSIVRVDDDTVQIDIEGEGTAGLTDKTAALDLVRTDTDPDQWLGVQVILPVVRPVTLPEPEA